MNVSASVLKKMSTEQSSTFGRGTPQQAIIWTIPVQDILGVINRTAYIVFPPEDDVTRHPPVNSPSHHSLSRTPAFALLASSTVTVRMLSLCVT